MEKTAQETMVRLGGAAGTAAGSWVFDGNTPDETIRATLKGYDDGDPEVMDMQPAPLSGEWADGPFIPDLLEEAGLERHYAGDDLDDLLTSYEDAYSEAYWGEVVRSGQAFLGISV